MASITIDPDALLTACPEVAINTKQPAPLSERLDELVRLANEAGARTNRKEIIGALLLAASADASELFDSLVTLRRSRAADAAVGESDSGSVLEFRRHPRGPRKRAGA